MFINRAVSVKPDHSLLGRGYRFIFRQRKGYDQIKSLYRLISQTYQNSITYYFYSI